MGKKKRPAESSITPKVPLVTEHESTHKNKKKTDTKLITDGVDSDLIRFDPPTDSSITVKVQNVPEQDHKLSPIVGYFPSGYDPLAGDESSEAKVRVLRHERHTKRLQVVVRPSESSPVEFAGTSYLGEGAAPQLCTYALGVLDKESLTLKILPIAANKIFRLEPKIGGSDVSEMEPSKSELTAENKAEKMKELTNMYSTKKAVSQARKREALYQNEDQDIQEDLDKKADEIKKNQEAIESAGVHHARNIPPHDISATTKEMAYPLNKIILTGEWDFLLDILALYEAEQDLAPEDYPSFVRNRVHVLEHKDEEERKKLSCIFSYITHLIKFKDKHSMEGVNSARYHNFPSIIHHKFSTIFTPTENKRLPEEKKDLLISYVLVLTLFVDGFDMNPSDIAKDLRMSDMKLRPHLEHLGCKKHVREGTLKFELRVPLQFPKLRSKRRR